MYPVFDVSIRKKWIVGDILGLVFSFLLCLLFYFMLRLSGYSDFIMFNFFLFSVTFGIYSGDLINEIKILKKIHVMESESIV